MCLVDADGVSIVACMAGVDADVGNVDMVNADAGDVC